MRARMNTILACRANFWPCLLLLAKTAKRF
jgi:hypothetical protein